VSCWISPFQIHYSLFRHRRLAPLRELNDLQLELSTRTAAQRLFHHSKFTIHHSAPGGLVNPSSRISIFNLQSSAAGGSTAAPRLFHHSKFKPPQAGQRLY